jgi:hypothetical protein
MYDYTKRRLESRLYLFQNGRENVESCLENLIRTKCRNEGKNSTRSRAMAQAVSRQPVIAKARVRAGFNPCGICGGQSDKFFRFLRFFPVIIIPPWHPMTWGISNRAVGGN